MVSSGYAVVVGGANLDLVAASSAAMVPGTSNPGRLWAKAGGVGRNVAENIARLGSTVQLVAPVGNDAWGEVVRTATAAAGVGVTHLLPAEATGTYTALLDDRGELVTAVSDMRASDDLSPAALTPVAELLAGARLLVLDANLQPHTLQAAARLAPGVPVIVEPVSTPKAERLRPLLEAGVDWFALTPNLDEVRALTGIADEQGGRRVPAPGRGPPRVGSTRSGRIGPAHPRPGTATIHRTDRAGAGRDGCGRCHVGGVRACSTVRPRRGHGGPLGSCGGPPDRGECRHGPQRPDP